VGAVALFDLCVGWRAFDDDALMMRAPSRRRLRQELDRLSTACSRPAGGPGGRGGDGARAGR
jgi:hypothetical protein